MKLCIVLLCLTATQVAATTLRSQETVSLDLNKVRLSSVLKTIEKKSDFRFAFSNKVVDKVAITLKIENVPVLNLLPTLLDGTGLEFQKLNDKLIVVREKTVATIIVKGIVANDKGEPVAGVTITSDKGETTVTDIKGEYTIEVNEDAQLSFTHISYKSQTVKVNGQTSVNVVLQDAERSLDEVVVTALGIKRQEKALGYATQKVSGQSLQTVKGVDLGTSLTGKVAGLVVKNSTEFNGRPSLEMRGESPLVIIDGVQYSNLTLRDIPTDDIESIDFLKGPTAAALYGAGGKNGAVMISTKKGKGKGVSVDFNTNNMFTLGYISIPKVQTSYGHGENGKITDDYVWGPKLDIGDSAMQWNPVTKKEEMMLLSSRGKNNLKNFMQTGLITNNNISVTQTGDNGYFRAGLNHIYNKGQFPNQKLNITNFTMGGEMRVGTKFSMEAHMGYTRKESPQVWGSGYGDQGYLYQILMWTGPEYDLSQYKDYWAVKDQKQNWLYKNWYDNPYYIAYEKLWGLNQNLMNASFVANYKFTDDLKLMLRSGYDYYKNEDVIRNAIGAISTRGQTTGGMSWSWNAKGMYGQNQTWGFTTTNDAILSYQKNFGKFGLDVLGGGSIRYLEDRQQGARTRNGLSVPGWYSLANAIPSTVVGQDAIVNNYGYRRSQVNSAYGKATLSWDNALFVDVTGRNDWFSTQPKSERSYFYPSVASSFILSEYIPLPQWVSMWKLRGSWTLSKSAASMYEINRTYSTGAVWGNVSASYPSNLYPLDLLPSSERTWEIGTAAYLFGQRLRLDVAYFNKLYYNTKISQTISSASGFGSTLINTDEQLVRRGLEVTLDGTIIKNQNLTWNSLINWSFQHRYYHQLDPEYSSDDAFTKVGNRLDIYKRDILLKDPSGNIIHRNGYPVESDYQYDIGYGDPNFSFGFSNTVNWKNIILGISIDGRIGGLMYNYIWDKMFDTGVHPDTDTKERYDEVVNKLTNYIGKGVKVVSGSVEYDKYGNITSDTRQYAPNDVAVGYQSYMQDISGKGEHGVMSESFAKLREISIGYQLPKSFLGNSKIKNASVSLTAQNVLLITGFKYSDPDRDTEDLNAPSQRMVGFSIKLGL
ncbi:SusC/RagA family TonB-linked outer membrane protein [Niabella sp. 22666]|uniref:SusC/RagA family TonB-linked outer membrane protein n=1 Tax=Niabella sp. 22666 TaxID=3453954 RepID=UPI003F86AC32